MKKRNLLLAFLTLLLLACTGCRALLEEPEHDDQLPWNTPAGWEDTIIGVPY